jgi:ribonucleoside-diphosphate reductase alpha chain
MPVTWSYDEALKETKVYFGGDDLATSAVVGKYLLKDKDNNFLEKTPDDMHRRLSAEFSRIEKKFEKNALTQEEIYELLKNFDFIIPQGSPMYGIGNDHAVVSLSNCVVVDSPTDDVSSIMNRGKDLANLFKRRCGVGVDISTLRPEGTLVSNSAGSTTGAWSFADFYSYICRMIGQNGRRGALMITMDIRHPDIEKFVTMKHDLAKVTGANVSVKINDEFMNAVENQQPFILQFPVDSEEPTHTAEIDSVSLWNLIVNSATKTAEPGLMMWDTIINNLPAHEYSDVGFNTVTTNPCGEIPLSPYDSCRLISINLVNFVEDPYTDKAEFNFSKFESVVAKAMRLSDDLVELEIEKLYKILEKVDTEDEKILWTNLLDACSNGRRTGLGTLGLGDTLCRLGIVYGSSESIEAVDKIYETLKRGSYEESINLAKERGPFTVFDWDKEKGNSFIQRLPADLKNSMEQHGRRNISILTNAPTGTCSIAAQTSSGIEPIFRLSYTRRKKINQGENAVTADFVDELGDKWQEFNVYHHEIKNYWEIVGKCEIDELPEFFITSDEIDWNGRIKVQAAIQNHVDHSISSTINLPKGTEPSVVGELYLNAWKSGLKGVTIYVDGSRSGVLVTKEDSSIAGDAIPNAQKRPEIVECEIHRAAIKGEDWTILVGLVNDTPYEIFGGLSEYVEIPRKYTSGKIRKRPRKTMANKYDLMVGKNGDEFFIKDIVKVFDNPNHTSFTRTISLALRHKVPLQFLVEQLQKDKEADMFSFSRVVARCLKKYIKDGTKVSNGIIENCCESSNIVYQEGCATCLSCGYAKCG